MAAPAAGRRAARAAVRSRPVDAGARDARRHDRQQRVRPARAWPTAAPPTTWSTSTSSTAGPTLHGALRRGRTRRRPRASTRSCAAHLDVIRTELGRFGRQVSGYSLEHLLPENGTDLAKALVGTEGTLAHAARRDGAARADRRRHPCSSSSATPTCRRPPTRCPRLLAHAPARDRGPGRPAGRRGAPRPGGAAVPRPAARWRLADGRGRRATPRRGARPRPRALAADGRRPTPSASSRPARRPRRCGGSARTAPGLGGRTPSGEQAWPGLRGLGRAARAAGRLPARARGADGRLTGVDGLAYGHFGDGCVHLRIDIPLERSGDRCARSCSDAAPLVARTAARCPVSTATAAPARELLPVMYSPAAIDAVRRVQGPVRPARPAQPRCAGAPRPARRGPAPPAGRAAPRATGAASPSRTTRGDLTTAVHRCVGVGKCRADNQRDRRLHVPVLPGDQGREGLHPRPRARAAGDGERHPGRRRLVARPRCTSRSTCACPARPVLVGLPRRRRHGAVQVRGAAPHLPGQAAPGQHYALGWLPRWARPSRAPRLAAGQRGRRLVRRQAVLAVGGMDPRRRW